MIIFDPKTINSIRIYGSGKITDTCQFLDKNIFFMTSEKLVYNTCKCGCKFTVQSIIDKDFMYCPKCDVEVAKCLGEKTSCSCDECKEIIHKSDCAVHNEPASKNGKCNCIVKKERKNENR